jgi:site-specific DNA-methyltransferase (adenine-specific)
VLGDVLQGLTSLPDRSFDLAIADPPYGASSPKTWLLHADHDLPRFGGAWKLAGHDWDRLAGLPYLEFTLRWISELKRLVKPTGSAWIHCTYHNAGIVNIACQLTGLEIINEVVWYKRNAFPNLSGRRLTASHETILWIHTGGKRRLYRFNYEDVKAAIFPGDRIKEGGRQLRTVWDIPNNKTAEERAYGKHPTQKPARLTQRMLLVSGVTGGALLLPFLGSGSEAVSGLRFGMAPTGFESDPGYFEIACKRISAATNPQVQSSFEGFQVET